MEIGQENKNKGRVCSRATRYPLLPEVKLGLLKGFLEPPLPNQQCLLPGQAGTRTQVLRLLPSSVPAKASLRDKELHRVTFSVLSVSAPRVFCLSRSKDEGFSD